MSEKKGAPAWMVSFGDMMTLILTFFILLVSMSRTQQLGLVASGVGSFLLAVRSFGLPGALDGQERAIYFEHVRQRFNLPAEDKDPVDAEGAATLELLRAKSAEALEPNHQISQPSLALFEPGSTVLTSSSKSYIDLLAVTLRPAGGQILLLEGHATQRETPDGDRIRLAYERARAVKAYLIERHRFADHRVAVRAWLEEIDPPGPELRSVDARLVIPAKRRNP